MQRAEYLHTIDGLFSTSRVRVRRKLRALVLASVALSVPMSAYAQEATSGLPGDWLARFTSARAIGLGGAFIAAADEPMGAVWNPACLSLALQNEVHFETARYFEDTVSAGEMLYLPYNVWHYFYSEPWSVTVNYWTKPTEPLLNRLVTQPRTHHHLFWHQVTMLLRLKRKIAKYA